MNEQQSFIDLIRIDQDIRGKSVLCVGTDAQAMTDWAVQNGAKSYSTIYELSTIDNNYSLPDKIKRVDTVIAREFFSELPTVDTRRNFVGMLKRLGTDAWYVQVSDERKLAQEVEATGEFGYLMTDTDFKLCFRMQLDDGKI